MTNYVQFRWTHDDKDYLILEREINWKFQVGEILRFWGGTSAVIKTETTLRNVEDYRNCTSYPEIYLEVIQIVWIDPIGWNPSTLEWESKQIVN